MSDPWAWLWKIEHDNGCVGKLVLTRGPEMRGTWAIHGEGEARRLFPDRAFVGLTETGAPEIREWLDAVHAYESRR